MKIVFLAPFGIRPKGTVLARMVPLAAELQGLGHKVVIVAPPYTNPEDSGKAETVRGVMIRNVKLARGGKALAAPVLAVRMLRAALAEKPDLVHLFKPKGYGGLAAMLHLFMLRDTPLFVDTDDWEGRGGMETLHDYSFLERHLYRLQEGELPRRAVGVTVASRMLETLVRGMGVPPERLLYLPNCVENVPVGDGEAVRRRLGISARTPVLLLYTRFFEFDQEKLHTVFGEVARRVPGVRFLVVGKGRHREEELLAAAADRNGFADSLTVAGWVEPEELPDWLAAGDVAIYPFADTVVNRAKCPAKLTELMRAGVPVVADRVGEIAEYVVSGESGILCTPDDWQEMAVRVAELLREPDLRKEMGAAGRKRILTHFAWGDAAVRLDMFYKALTGKGNDTK
ncbi:glycosyltransferase family 4 protein [Geobacter pickeringii]|uniref:Glycoside hydrolase n=1 Tax=Geobacter pickeringii TaxID=345632 RepID=A0A0B5BI55_9BACT|nr:glycosyltransferase family 4 protein [Geobacter pickeringii]AJE04185.1 glycoside hydrolase [Geobacter pickeringii]